MSTAFYPTNMRRQSASGYSNHSILQNIPYISWKGSGLDQNPIGNAPVNIRPLTNNDPGNAFPSKFGLPRPIKQYRKGRSVSLPHAESDAKLYYNINRNVNSSARRANLFDIPGAYVISNASQCNGTTLVSDWMPIHNLTEKPSATNNSLQERKAKRRVLPPRTNISKDYYQTNYSHLYNRCQTFKQRQFNFVSSTNEVGDSSITNQYVAQCPSAVKSIEISVVNSLAKSLLDSGWITQENYNSLTLEELTIDIFMSSLHQILTAEQYNHVVNYLSRLGHDGVLRQTNHRCSRVYYKPNNPQYATQGSVSSSARLLKLNVDTINRHAYLTSINPSNVATSIQSGINANVPYIYKDKVEQCNDFHSMLRLRTV
jgi:hypothetical protein